MSKMHKSKRKRGGNTISMKADLNKDKIITVSEIQKYVSTEVSILSDGAQTPTSRIQNNVLDYRVW